MSRSKLTDRNVTLTSMLVSISDVTLNLVVALITGSQAVLAQSLQGISDLVAAVILYVGVDRSKKAPDHLHPLGYGREIYFWVLIAGVFMFLGTGALSFYFGYQQLVDPGEIDNVWLALGMLSFGLVTNYYAFSKSRRRLLGKHKKIGWRGFMRSSLIETKATFLIDFLGSVSAVFGLLAVGAFAITNNARFDGVGGMMVGLSMMFAAGLLIFDVKGLIVGRKASATVEKKIIDTVMKFKAVEEVLDLRTLYLGSSKMLVLLEVHFNDSMGVNQIERLSDQIKAAVKKNVPSTYHIQVEAETPDGELQKSHER